MSKSGPDKMFFLMKYTVLIYNYFDEEFYILADFQLEFLKNIYSKLRQAVYFYKI